MATAKINNDRPNITLDLTWDEARALTALVGKTTDPCRLASVWDALAPFTGTDCGDDFQVTADVDASARVYTLNVRDIS